MRIRTDPSLDAERRERRVGPHGQLLGRALVECDRAERRGSTPPSMSQAIRATSVVVLPLPAGATHRMGPGRAVAAAR